MKRPEWIVCERDGHWAAALRTMAARQESKLKSTSRVVEVRSLAELSNRLDEQPALFALVEVHGGNLADVLVWLTDARTRYGRARFVALLDYRRATSEVACWSADRTGGQDVADALMEAGAVAFADSPRYLQNVLAMARRHESLAAVDIRPFDGDQPLLEWARSLLPWQDR
jgi:hypothetical protein